MAEHDRLSIEEEALLLCLDDTSGSFHPYASHFLGAVLLADLVWKGHLAIVEKGIITVLNRQTGDRVRDSVVDLLSAAHKPQDAARCLRILGHGLRPETFQIADGLVQKGILRREEGKLFWIFPVRRYPTRDSVPESEIDDDLRRIILTNSSATPTDALLVTLLAATGNLRTLLTRKELREASERLGSLEASDPVIALAAGALRHIVSEDSAGASAVAIAVVSV